MYFWNVFLFILIKEAVAERWRSMSTCGEAGRSLRCSCSLLVTCHLRSRFLTLTFPSHHEFQNIYSNVSCRTRPKYVETSSLKQVGKWIELLFQHQSLLVFSKVAYLNFIFFLLSINSFCVCKSKTTLIFAWGFHMNVFSSWILQSWITTWVNRGFPPQIWRLTTLRQGFHAAAQCSECSSIHGRTELLDTVMKACCSDLETLSVLHPTAPSAA